MGYDLISTTDEGFTMRFGAVAWPKVQALGRLYGWVPAGTAPSCRCGEFSTDPDLDACLSAAAASAWTGTYDANAYQVVSEEDAAAWADALERALPDVPDHEALGLDREHLLADPETAARLMERLGARDAGEPILVSVRALAEAGKLDQAPAFARWWWQFVGQHDPGVDATIPDPTLSPLQFFSGAGKGRLSAFISFCRFGGFWIG